MYSIGVSHRHGYLMPSIVGVGSFAADHCRYMAQREMFEMLMLRSD